MKAKIVGSIFVCVVAFLTTFNVTLNVQDNAVELLFMEDIEALAQIEIPDITEPKDRKVNNKEFNKVLNQYICSGSGSSC